MKIKQEEAKFVPIKIILETREELNNLYENLLSAYTTSSIDGDALSSNNTLIKLLDEYI